MAIDFFTIDYLKQGSPIQQSGYAALIKSNVLDLLKKYNPVLAGTLPLDIFIQGSDLDILCFAPDLSMFEKDLQHFSAEKDFRVSKKQVNDALSLVCNFKFHGFEFEIFGQPIPTLDQHAYRHLLIEHAILEREGNVFRDAIIDLKESGVKTEPAFAKLLSLPGDPYDALLKYPLASGAGKQSN